MGAPPDRARQRQERLGIPQPEHGEDVLRPAGTTPAIATSTATVGATPRGCPDAIATSTVGAPFIAPSEGVINHAPTNIASAKGEGEYLGATLPRPAAPPYKQDADTLAETGDAIIAGWLEQLRAIVSQAQDMDALQNSILSAFGDMDSDRLAHIMALAFELAELRGMDDVRLSSPLAPASVGAPPRGRPEGQAQGPAPTQAAAGAPA